MTIVTSLFGLFPEMRNLLSWRPTGPTVVIVSPEPPPQELPVAADVLPVQGRTEPSGYRTSIQVDTSLTP